MYILVFIIKKQVRNWEIKRQIHVVAALCAELRGNAARELQPPSRERYRSLWRFRETKHLFSESWWNLFPFSCQEAEVGTAAESQLPSSPPAKTLGKELSHWKFQSFKVIAVETVETRYIQNLGNLTLKTLTKIVMVLHSHFISAWHWTHLTFIATDCAKHFEVYELFSLLQSSAHTLTKSRLYPSWTSCLPFGLN